MIQRLRRFLAHIHWQKPLVRHDCHECPGAWYLQWPVKWCHRFYRQGEIFDLFSKYTLCCSLCDYEKEAQGLVMLESLNFLSYLGAQKLSVNASADWVPEWVEDDLWNESVRNR